VEKDPTAFYSYEEFETGVDTMRRFCSLRSKSISMQLANGETVNNMGYVDGSGITLSDMGSMRMGGEFGRGSMPGDFGDEMPKALDFSQIPGGFNGRFPDPFSDKTEVASLENERGTDLWGNDNRPSRDNMQMPGGDFNFNMNSTGNPASGSTNLLWLAVSVLILGVGLIIAKAYK
jgi:hypothetical protein